MYTSSRYFCVFTLAVLSLWLPCLPASAKIQPPSIQEIALPTATLADSEHIELVGRLGGMAQSVAIQGNYAYVGFGSEFAVLDISNPAAVQRVSWLVSAGEVKDISIEGDYAYIAYGGNQDATGLQVIDIHDPTFLASLHITEFRDCGRAPHISTQGATGYFAYAACGIMGQNEGSFVYRLDISTPSNPSIVTYNYYFMSSFAGITPGNGWLYAIWEDVSGVYLKVFDTTAPSDLVDTNTIQVANGSNAIALLDQYAFLAASGNGMQVVAISDPANPTPVITHTLPGTAQDIFIAEDFAYLAAGEAGLQIVDITDPLNPLDAGSYATGGSSTGLFISNGYAYLANMWGGFEIVQLSDLTQAGLVELPEMFNDLAIRDPYAFVAAEDGLWIIDLADPSLPVAIAHDVTETPCLSLVLKDDYAYLACPQIGLRIMDISNPQTPSEAGIYDLLGDSRDMVIVDQTLFVARSGLLILDISNPLAPVEISNFLVGTNNINEVAVAGDYAFLGVDNGNLVVLDISDPFTPTETGGYDPADRYGIGQEATAIQVQDNIVYLTTVEPPPTPLAGDYIGDTWLIDVSDKENPALVSSISTSGAPFDLSVNGGFAAVAYEREGLRLYDISNPATPLERGSYNPSEDIYGVAIAGDLVYLYNNSLFITQYISSTTQIYLPVVPQSVSDSMVHSWEISR